MGLLADDFKTPYLHHYKLTRTSCTSARTSTFHTNPSGIWASRRAKAGGHTTPPRENGNIDIRHLTPGARLYLPVLVKGALFSCGDCHSAQGDGEVNGTGIESPMSVTLKFGLIKRAKLPELRFFTPRRGPLSKAGAAGYFVTTAHGPDLFKNAQNAVRYMVEHIAKQYKMSPEQAYCLCGAAVDLKISEIVDAPNWIVSAYLPLAIFRR